MERQDLERIFTYFQAKARGFLVRKELSGVRQDYKDIVREIEGDHSHLEWRGDIIAIPHFTKNASTAVICQAFVWQSNKSPSNEISGEPHSGSALRQPLGEPSKEASEEVPQVISDSPVAVRELQQRGQSHCVVRDSESSNPAGGDGERTWHTSELNLERLEEGEPGSVAEETSAWDSTAMRPGYSFLEKGSPRRSLAKDIPRKEEELCLHRNNLSMELLWLQQAINSRKKYLLLKQRLGVPER